MFPFYREDLIRSEAEERERMERRNHLLRELRGAAPPFDGGLTRRLVTALAETAGGSSQHDRGSRTASPPRPKVKEVMSS